MIDNRIIFILWTGLIFLFTISPTSGVTHSIQTPCGVLAVNDNAPTDGYHTLYPDYEFDSNLISGSNSDASTVSLKWYIKCHSGNILPYSATVYIQKAKNAGNITEEDGEGILKSLWSRLYGDALIPSFGQRTLVSNVFTGDHHNAMVGQAFGYGQLEGLKSFAAIYSPAPGYAVIFESNSVKFFKNMIQGISFKP